MAKNLFSVPIFFIVFRETLEASIIISVLLGLVEQIARPDSRPTPLVGSSTLRADEKRGNSPNENGEHVKDKEDPVTDSSSVDSDVRHKRLLRKMRIQVSASHLTLYTQC